MYYIERDRSCITLAAWKRRHYNVISSLILITERRGMWGSQSAKTAGLVYMWIGVYMMQRQANTIHSVLHHITLYSQSIIIK